jgi:subfamily B ATP-binding cassette protein HlyB/CyaB
MPQRETRAEDCFWLLGSLSNLYRIPFDAALVASQFPPPYTRTTFHEAARALGFKTGTRPLPSNGWDKHPFPCIAFLKPQSQSKAPSDVDVSSDDHQVIPFPAHMKESLPPSAMADETPEAAAEILTPILIVKTDGHKLLYFRSGTQVPQTINITDLPNLIEPELILVAREQAGEGVKPEDIAGFETEKPKFGFRWFIPELLKHKKIWRDVVLASLAIQLVGLATPVFTQVIIDKVVVHQTSSTLVVIGVALAMFMLFTMAMTWLRQYLVLHTGNRIDAVLGSQVFRHLLRLPLPYFEQRGPLACWSRACTV